MKARYDILDLAPDGSSLTARLSVKGVTQRDETLPLGDLRLVQASAYAGGYAIIFSTGDREKKEFTCHLPTAESTAAFLRDLRARRPGLQVQSIGSELLAAEKALASN